MRMPFAYGWIRYFAWTGIFFLFGPENALKVSSFPNVVGAEGKRHLACRLRVSVPRSALGAGDRDLAA